MILDVDPFAPEMLADPDDMHAALREAGPTVYLSRYDVHATARYTEVREVLRDWQQFESSAGVGLANFREEEPWRPPSLLLEADPPHHDAPRAVLTSVLGPRALRGLRDAWFADAERLVDEVFADTRDVIDGITELAQAFPLRVFPDAVGIGKEGREHLLPYGDHAFNAFGPRNALVAEGEPRVPELSAWIATQCARESLTPDGFGAQIWAAADHGDITHDQAPRVVRSLLTAGVDTTIHSLAAVLYAFASHPEQWQRLRDQPTLARVAFDEAVRWQSPVQTFFRTAAVDRTLGDVPIPKGGKILLFLGSANRDPRRWPTPNRFDLDRDPAGHVGFGTGIHQCVGQHVARLEAEALLTALAHRVTRVELAGPPRRHLNNTVRAWASLPMKFHLTR